MTLQKVIREKVRLIEQNEVFSDDFLRQLLQGNDATWESNPALSQLLMLSPYIGLSFNTIKTSAVRLILDRFLNRV